MLRREPIKVEAALMGLISMINPFSIFNSSPRIGMVYNHIRQACHPFKPDIPYILHGYENQLRAYDIRMPETGVVVSIHHKYRKVYDSTSIKENPLVTIIFQNTHTGEYDYLNIHEYNTNHSTFGSRYVLEPIVKDLQPGSVIQKGTILAKSPAKLKGDIYSNSLTANIVAVGLPVSIEDGYGASESFCERAGLLELKKVTGSFGKRCYLLNAYGTEKEFKGFPNPGEKIRDDGIIMAFREYNEHFDVLNMTNEALMQIDTIHDIRIYGDPGSTVYDVTVESGIGETTMKPRTPPNIAKQCNNYINQLSNYYTSLIETEIDKIRKKSNNKKILLSKGLTQLLVRSYGDKPNDSSLKTAAGGRVRRGYKKEELDEYYIHIRTYKQKPLKPGAKITNLHGMKGVICGIFPDHQMPVDEDGNVADLIYYKKAQIARTDTGGSMEGHTAACIRDVSKKIKKLFNHKHVSVWNEQTEEAWNYLVSFYESCSPLTHEWSINPTITIEDKLNHINVVIDDIARIVFTIDNPLNNLGLIDRLDEVIKPTYGALWVTDVLGRKVKLKSKGFMEIQQIIVLEKTELNPMSVNAAIRQIHGFPAGSNRQTRYSNPAKVQALRNASETEIRFWANVWGSDVIARYIAFAYDPDAIKDVITAIMNSPIPLRIGNVKSDIERSRALKLVKDVFFCYGLIIKKKVYEVGNSIWK